MDFYTFGLGNDLKNPTAELLGGKGAGLMWMSGQGIPVPPGFVIPTTVWAEWDTKPKTIMKELNKVIVGYLDQLKAHFGYMPLLSVRSGARVSMPGMMDTILNIGLDTSTAKEWMVRLNEECYQDSVQRLVMMYGSVVEGINRHEFDGASQTALEAYTAHTGAEFPNAKRQLLGSIEAVFQSWDNDRAKKYRELNAIPREWGTAVVVQAMVFGNLNKASGTGVLFTRNPDTGSRELTGEFLVNAQGEDVVAGTRTPVSLEAMYKWYAKVTDELRGYALELEKLKKDAQDIEFTVQDGKLYILQTRDAKRSPTAAIRIALDMVKEGLISEKTAVQRVSIRQFDGAQLSTVDPKFTKPAVFTGIPACSGVVSGKPVFSTDEAITCKEPCILITQETTPDDLAGMDAAQGIITMVGGMTSHAAVVARGMNRPCIVGVGQSLEVFKEADTVGMNAATGQIWMEAIPIFSGESNGLIHQFSQLVFSVVGAVPVIFGVPVHDMDQALLYLGDHILHPKQAAQLVRLTAEKVKTLYLDLVVGVGFEEEYFALCGGFNAAQRVLDELHNGNALNNTVIIVGGDELITHDYRTLPTGKDLRSLVMADGEILDGISALDYNLDPAIAKVLAWKQTGGLKMVSLGKVQPGCKSLVSVHQALQLIGGI